MNSNTRSHTDYSVGWVCVLPQEQTAAMAMLDKRHESLSKPPTDTNAYTLGSIGQHNIVIACLPKGNAGQNSAATVATQMIQTFSSIKIGLLVGIGGGIPPKVRLGDVVVSTPDGQFPGVVQWDPGKLTDGGHIERTGSLNNPPNSLLSALGKLESKHELEGSTIPVILERFKEAYPLAAKKYLNAISLKDVLFKSDYLHVRGKPTEDNGMDDNVDEDGSGTSDDEEEEGCVSCDKSQTVRRKRRSMRIHYGLIASSNVTIEDAEVRDRLHIELGKKVLCVEMEAAGLMNCFPCIVIRGICDYADSHRNKAWQKYAAAVAAAFAKELLGSVQSSDVEGERPIRDILNDAWANHRLEWVLLLVRDELNQISQNLKAGFGETKKGLDNLIEVQKVQEQNEALTWLSSIDSASMHHEYIKKCEPGTGQSLLVSEEIRQWISNSQTTLFCSGIPGAGKTFQMAILIDHLTNKFQHDGTIGLAFFYYRFDRQDTQKPEQLIANLIKQLGQDHQPSREKILEFYENHKTKGTWPLIKELVDLLKLITSLLSRAYVIIDALDECDDNDYSRTRSLDSLFAAQEKGLNICATSRQVHIIEQRFEAALKWQITPTKNDIYSFLDTRMAQLPDFVQSNIHLQEEIKRCIESAIEGMFLLAQLYIDSLVGKRSVASIRRALGGLKTFSEETRNRSDVLNTAYHKAMERIQQQKGDLPTDAMTILAWVVKSRKPLPLGTLRLILAIDTEKFKIDEDNFPTADHITQACAPLVLIESKTQEARLAHYTIQEYFERSNNTWMEKSQKLIANTCMSYLSFSTIRSVFKNKVDDEGYFHSYATEFWAYHTEEALSTRGLEVQRVMHFLDKREKSALWHDSLMQIDLARTHLSASSTDELLQISEHVVELHVAACLGLSDVVAELIKMGCDPDVRDKRNRSPLWWAAYNGHAGIVELLLEQKVDIEVKDTFSYRTPLKLAAKRGLVSIVGLLLDKDANLEPGNRDETRSPVMDSVEVGGTLALVNAKFRPYNLDTFDDNWWYLSPLASAAEGGHEDISAMLLRCGAKIETKNDYGPTISALNVAVDVDHGSIVKLLLAHGADMEIRDEEGLTALQIAVKGRRPNIVHLLLSYGADINTRDEEGCTPLHKSTSLRSEGVLKILLANGADMELRDNAGWTALQVASRHDETKVVELLLANGADVEARDQEGCTALHIATRFNQLSAADFLLSQGADIEAKNKHGETPLIIASRYRSQETFNALISHGADMAARDHTGQSVLSWAMASSAFPAAEIVKLLISKNFTLEKYDVGLYGGRMLLIAVEEDDASLLDWLLQYNVDVNYRDRLGWAPLHWAVEKGYITIVSRLLEVDGIDADAKNGSGFDALTMAFRGARKEIAKLLINSGKVRTAFGRPEFLDFLRKNYR
ncbi:ankyrin repeat-containing domain protein [Trichoderma afarasin]